MAGQAAAVLRDAMLGWELSARDSGFTAVSERLQLLLNRGVRRDVRAADAHRAMNLVALHDLPWLIVPATHVPTHLNRNLFTEPDVEQQTKEVARRIRANSGFLVGAGNARSGVRLPEAALMQKAVDLLGRVGGLHLIGRVLPSSGLPVEAFRIVRNATTEMLAGEMQIDPPQAVQTLERIAGLLIKRLEPFCVAPTAETALVAWPSLFAA